MQPRLADRIGLWIVMAVWLVSFFLPAITPALGSWRSDNPKNDVLPGFFAAVASAVQFGIVLPEIQKSHSADLSLGLPLLASTCAWFANALMFVAPTFFRRVRAKKGAVYLVLMLGSSFLIVVLPLFNTGRSASGIESFHYGYFVWSISILFMTLFLLGLRLQATETARNIPANNGLPGSPR